MRRCTSIVLLVCLASSSGACIAPSVVQAERRALDLGDANLEWSPAQASDLPGVFVSTELSGPLAASLGKLVYRFGSDGSYTGAALLDGDPPHFEVLAGRWAMVADRLVLDDAPPASVEVAPDGSLRLAGEDGRVVLRRELSR